MIERLVTIGLFLILLVAPTQSSFPVKGVYLSPADPLIWLTGLVWFIGVVFKPDWRKLPFGYFPPLVNLLFPLLIALSFFKAENIFAAGKELFQIVEYVIVAFMLFSQGITNRKLLDQLVELFLVLVTGVVLLGVVQYFHCSRPVMEVKSTFGNRNVYGGFLAIALPLVLARLLLVKNWGSRIWLGLTFFGGIISLLSGGAALALLIASGVVCGLKSNRALLVWGGTVVVMVSLILPFLPRENPRVWCSSMAIYDDQGNPESRYLEWQASAQMWQEEPLLGVGVGNYQTQIGSYYGYLEIPEGTKEADDNNFFLVFGSSTGVIGLVGMLLMLTAWLRTAFSSLWNSKFPNYKFLALGAIGAIVAFCIASMWTALLIRGVFLPFIFIVTLPYAMNSLRSPE